MLQAFLLKRMFHQMLRPCLLSAHHWWDLGFFNFEAAGTVLWWTSLSRFLCVHRFHSSLHTWARSPESSCRDCVAHFTKLLRCFTFPFLARGSRILTSSPQCHYLLSVLVDVLLLNTLHSSNLCFIRCQPCVRHWYKLWGPRWRAEAQISVVGNTWWVVISGQAW